MKYRLFLFGLFFLINPYFWVFDVLPDFIGLLIMAKAIRSLTDVSPSMEAASNGLKKAAALSISQLGLTIPMMTLVNSDPTFNMVFSFCFNILRIIILIPTLHELFNGFVYFADRHAEKGHTVSTVKLKTVRTVMQIYIILHSLLSAFPEIVYFKVNDSGMTESVEEIYPLAPFRLGIMFLCACIVALLSLIFYVIICVYFSSLRKKAEFNRGITSDIASYVRSERKRIMTAVKPAMTCFIIACFCAVGYYIDGKALIPPYFTPILHIAVISYLRRILDKKVTRAFSIVAVIVSVPLQVFSEFFATEYHETASFAFSEIETKFLFPYYLNIAYTVFLVLSTVCIGIALYRVIKDHTVLFWESAYITHNSKAVNEKLRRLRLSVLLTCASSLLAVFNCYTYGKLYSKPMLNTYALLIGVIVGVCASLLCSSVRTAVLEKYSTENKMN
ncbi:MAG: hypothetical protein IJY94_02285 [Clostridia bacterium]|nr:hypothetical protein [Clostridia bacterium]